MKKIYTILAAAAFSVNLNAQTVVDFESFTLSTESYHNGSGGGGDFYLSPLYLNNSYDTSFSSWSGFSISNMTDVTTPGWMNQYSAYTGSGADGSSNYGMAYWSPEIWVSGAERIDSFEITNSTYAYLSMRDGDGYGKQFGSPLDGNGVVDGTNGEDFFKVWIFGEDAAGTTTDSIEFFLADYRFMDSTQDYIVDEWVNIDLTGFSFEVARVYFEFESSDNDPTYGMKTPAYFAIDNIAYQGLQNINENALVDYTVYPNPFTSTLHINGGAGSLMLTDASGNVLMQMEHNTSSNLECGHLSAGVYFLSVSNSSGTSTQKIIK